MKYIVDVKDISYGRIEVEAESIEEAQEKAEELYFSGMVPWADCDVSYEARPDYRTPAYYDRNGNEIKEWYALAAYLQMFGEEGIPETYATSDGRKDVSSEVSFTALGTHLNWISILALVIIFVPVLLMALAARFVIFRKRRKKK